MPTHSAASRINCIRIVVPWAIHLTAVHVSREIRMWNRWPHLLSSCQMRYLVNVPSVSLTLSSAAQLRCVALAGPWINLYLFYYVKFTWFFNKRIWFEDNTNISILFAARMWCKIAEAITYLLIFLHSFLNLWCHFVVILHCNWNIRDRKKKTHIIDHWLFSDQQQIIYETRKC